MSLITEIVIIKVNIIFFTNGKSGFISFFDCIAVTNEIKPNDILSTIFKVIIKKVRG